MNYFAHISKETLILILNSAIIICTVILAILALADHIGDKFPIFKKLWFKISFISIITLIASLTPLWKDSIKDDIAKHEQDRRDSIYELKLLHRDSLNRVFTDSSNSRIIINFAEGLAKYSLKYDSSQRKIEQLVLDSANKIININYGQKPSIGITDVYIKGRSIDSSNLILTVCYFNYPENINLKYDVYGVINGNFRYLGSDILRNGKKSNIPNDEYCEDSNWSIWNEKYIKDIIVFHLIGDYTDYIGNSKYTIDLVYMYNRDRKKIARPTIEFEQKFRDSIKISEVY